MSTAKPRKTSPRGTTRKRNNGNGSEANDSPVAGAPAIDAAPLADAPISSSQVIDSQPTELLFHETEHEIRIRAYELYLSRGGADGDDLSDWLEAERVVRNSRPSTDDDRENRSSPPA